MSQAAASADVASAADRRLGTQPLVESPENVTLSVSEAGCGHSPLRGNAPSGRTQTERGHRKAQECFRNSAASRYRLNVSWNNKERKGPPFIGRRERIYLNSKQDMPISKQDHAL